MPGMEEAVDMIVVVDAVRTWWLSKPFNTDELVALVLELVCTVGLIVPAALHWKPALTVVAATILAIESLVFVWVPFKYHEVAPIIMSGMLGLLLAFIAYGRMALKPIS